jgi:LemA protein
MDAGAMIASAVAGVVVVYVIFAYNRLVARRNHVLEAWSGIDVQLRRRHDLLPKLVDAVKAYTRYEEKTLQDITRLRAVAQAAGSDRSQAENGLTATLRRLFALAEAYPDLKASSGYLDLQRQISETEEQIQYARRYYNGTVRELNIQVESFPGNLVAGLFGFRLKDYFEIELATQRESPELNLG